MPSIRLTSADRIAPAAEPASFPAMTDRERVRLLHGPGRPPQLRAGGRAF
jgi:hypothetical protein